MMSREQGTYFPITGGKMTSTDYWMAVKTELSIVETTIIAISHSEVQSETRDKFLTFHLIRNKLESIMRKVTN